MPPMVLDDLGGSSLQIGPVPRGPSIFKHPVPFNSSINTSVPATPPSERGSRLKDQPYTSERLAGISDEESDNEIGRGKRLRSTQRATSEQTSHKEGISEADIESSPPIYPKSLSKHFKPPLSPCSEQTAVRDLLVEDAKLSTSLEQPADDFVEFELSDFAIYLPGSNKAHPYELRGLQHLATKSGHSSFLFDGILSVGNSKRYVKAVPFQICSIGNYGEDIHDVGSDIWLQSDANAKTNIYYRLKHCSPQYQLYHEGFVWLANLAKHFIDFCQAAPEGKVSIHNFRSDFSNWVKSRHDMSPDFQAWYSQYGNDDFRTHIAVNINFLFKESVGVNSELRSEPIFSEVKEIDSIPQQKIVEHKTIVTPYVYECFKHLRFGEHLKSMDIASGPRLQQVNRGASLNLTKDDHVQSSHVEVPVASPSSSSTQPRVIETRSPRSNQATSHQRMISNIKPGDVLSVVKDGKDSLWKDEISPWKTADDCWYVCVQVVHKIADGSREFDAIWLYKPSDTSCAKMKYPFSNELYLSDNCTCSQKRITEDEILSIEKIRWNGAPTEQDSRIFVRQTYLENERFVTFQKAHKRCKHMQLKGTLGSTGPAYQTGQTVLAAPVRKSKNLLEAYEIVKFLEGGDCDKEEVVLLRRLQRRQAVDGKGRPNELVYTDFLDPIPVNKIDGACLVRFYQESDISDSLIPAPYSRDGTGNAFYITTRLVEVKGMGTLQPVEHDIPSSLLQGFDPLKQSPRLRGLDLYCGGGNFGRGLEEGGAVHNEWAVDINRTAIHTYAANLKDAQQTKLFFGSVNDMLSQAMRGNPLKSELIPAPGDVDFVSAGSPCQGFSLMNSKRNNFEGLRNQSLVASVAAYIDFYRPKYGLLENVMNMAQKGRGRDEDVLSQLICAIVGLGYQLRMFVVDAWSCGMPQSRTRLFVSFAAPGLTPLEHPKLSHSHPMNREQERSLGLMANGEAFGRRLRGPTPFEFVSAGSGTADLPDINQGCTYQCIKQPEHVMPYSLKSLRRHQIEAVPKRPYAMNFYKTYSQGLMTPTQASLFCMVNKAGTAAERFSKTSRAWGRMDPKVLFPAILGSLHISDARNGPCIHWEGDRIMTILEAKRAQGFLDNEVLVGNSTDSFKIIGNSVARGVALALGLSLHEAWMQDGPRNVDISTPPVAVVRVDKEKFEGRRILEPSRRRRSQHVIPVINEGLEVQGSATSNTVSDDESSDAESYTTAPDQPIRNEVNSRSCDGFLGLSSQSLPAELRDFLGLSHQSLSASTASTGGSSSSSSRDAARIREIRASSESSIDDSPLSEPVFDNFIGYIATREKNQPPARGQSTAGLKRSFDMVEPATPESHKVPRQSIYESRLASSYRVVSPSRNGTDKRIDASVLADRLADLVSQSCGHLVRPIPDSESESEEDIKFIPAATYNFSAARSNHIRHRLSEQGTKATSKSKVVISLLSDDEDDTFSSSSVPAQQRKDTASNKPVPRATYPPYVPVDNSSLNVYAQTNQYMKFDVNRRHGPKSTW